MKHVSSSKSHSHPAYHNQIRSFFKRHPMVWKALPLFVILFGYVFYPLMRTFAESFYNAKGVFSLENYRTFFDPQRPANIEALLTSLGLGVASVLISALVGVPLAFLFTKFEFPGRSLFSKLVVIPMVFPPMVSVLTYIFLYGEAGMIPKGLQDLFGLSKVPFFISGLSGILVIHAYTQFIYFYTMTSSALRKIDASVDEAARNLGGGFWFRFRKITLPLLTPGLVGASLLVFMIAINSFSAPYLLGGNYRFLSMQVYISKMNGKMPMAATQATILASFCILVLFLIRWFSQLREYKMVGKGVSVHTTEIKNPWTKYIAMVVSIIALVILSLPQITLFVVSLVPSGTWTTQTFPPVYSWVNYKGLLNNPRLATAVRNSLTMSAIATGVSILLGSTIAYFLSKKEFKLRWAMEILTMLPWALPGTIIAINLIVAFNKPTLLTFNRILVGTYWILPVAYVVKIVPLITRSVFAVFEQLDDSLEEAGRNLGGKWLYVFRRIIWPNILPGIMSGALLALVSTIGEFTSSIMLYTFSNKPMSIEILDQMQNFNYGAAAAMGTIQVILIAAALVVTNQLFGREQGDSGIYL